MQALASLVFAVVPMLLYLWIIWVMDRYDREPLSLLALNFLWGAIGAIVFGLLGSQAIKALLGTSHQQDVVLVAPMIEEFAKGLFLLYTARDRRFDNITDGVVYGMAIGLGFGMTENFLYFLHAKTADEWAERVILRTFYTAVMHAMATGMFGVFVGVGKYRFRRLRWALGPAGIAAAIGIHMLWNHWSLLDVAELPMFQGLFIALGLLVILAVMQVSLFTENQVILSELLEEARDGLLPQVHLNYLPYSSKRKILGWLPPSIDRRVYVQLATRLAFRKSQLRHTRGDERARLLDEIAGLRGEIGAILRAESESDAARLY